MRKIFSDEYKAAWKKCLNIARHMCHVPMNSPKRKELEKQLEIANKEREAIRAKEKAAKALI